LPLFRSRAEQLCGQALGADAEDVCQEACIKAMVNLGRLRNADAFCPWVLGFTANEVRNWRRKAKKFGTSTEELTLREVERMSVTPPSHSASDMAYLLSLLRRQARRVAGPDWRTAAFMLKYYGEEQEFPPVRTIAEATHSSHGTAQRWRETVLAAWRRTLTAFDLKP
jgi:DNA-directed RNA polymerase specialized sigma24 family protein